MEHQTREFAFFITSQALPHSLSQTGAPEAADTSSHESCVPPDTPAGCAERLMMTTMGRDYKEWGFIFSHLTRCLRGGAWLNSLCMSKASRFCWSIFIRMLVSRCLGSCRSAWWAPVLCHGDVQKGKQVQQRWGINKSLQTAIREWENDWLVFLSLLLENKNCTLQSQRRSYRAVDFQGSGRRDQWHGGVKATDPTWQLSREELVLTCPLEHSHLQETLQLLAW